VDISGTFYLYALKFGMDIGVDLKKYKMPVANLLKIISGRLTLKKTSIISAQ
jgi:hypothetical protein